MSVSAKDIAAARALRDEALALVTAHFEDVRTDLSPQMLGDRLKHKASEQAVEAIEGTRAVVSENKIVIGLTFAGLIGWFARGPIVRLGSRMASGARVERLAKWRVR